MDEGARKENHRKESAESTNNVATEPKINEKAARVLPGIFGFVIYAGV